MRTPRHRLRSWLSVAACLGVAAFVVQAAAPAVHGLAHEGRGVVHDHAAESSFAPGLPTPHGDAGHEADSCGVCRLISQLRAVVPLPSIVAPSAAHAPVSAPLASPLVLRSAPRRAGSGPRAPPGLAPLA